MNENVKNKTGKLPIGERSHGMELVAAFALPGGVQCKVTPAQVERLRREVEADPAISPSVKQALLALSGEELGQRLR